MIILRCQTQTHLPQTKVHRKRGQGQLLLLLRNHDLALHLALEVVARCSPHFDLGLDHRKRIDAPLNLGLTLLLLVARRCLNLKAGLGHRVQALQHPTLWYVACVALLAFLLALRRVARDRRDAPRHGRMRSAVSVGDHEAPQKHTAGTPRQHPAAVRTRRTSSTRSTCRAGRQARDTKHTEAPNRRAQRDWSPNRGWLELRPKESDDAMSPSSATPCGSFS